MTKKEFEKKYNLIPSDDSLLQNKLELFDFNNPPVDPEELSKDLLEHMKHFGGIGLSANQVGLPYRVFVMVGDIVCFNPKITAYAGEELMLDEGCLSYPGLYIKKRRPEMIRCRYFDATGKASVHRYSGMTSRIFQHEYEHMEGESFLDGIGEFALRRAKEKQQKLIKKVGRQRKRLLAQQKKKKR